MPAGFESYTDTGFIQLSAELPGLKLISKGLATIGGPVTFSSKGHIKVVVPASVQFPIVAVRHPGGVAPLSRIYNPNTNTYEHTFITGASSGSVAYYIFDISTIEATATNFGLEVYDANAKLTYSTGNNSANVYSVLGSYGSVNLVAGRSYATVIPTFAGYRTQTYHDADATAGNPYYSQDSKMWAGVIAGNVASAELIEFMSATAPTVVAPAPNYDTPLAGMLVVDVTPYGPIAGEDSFSLTMSPSTQSQSAINSANTFSPTTVSVVGIGSPSSYTWRIDNASGGTWSITGQGTATATASVSGVPAFDGTNPAFARLVCSCVVNGVTKETYSDLTYSNGTAAAPSFTPAPGSYSNSGGTGTATFTITAPQAVTWTWTKSGASQATASIPSGTSGTGIAFNLPAGALDRSAVFTVTASGALSGSWTISLDTNGTA